MAERSVSVDVNCLTLRMYVLVDVMRNLSGLSLYDRDRQCCKDSSGRWPYRSANYYDVMLDAGFSCVDVPKHRA